MNITPQAHLQISNTGQAGAGRQAGKQKGKG